MDYFNRNERALQRRLGAWRDKAFGPLLEVLAPLGATPNQVSATGVACMVAAALLPPTWALPAVGLLAAYVFCDALDGPLARRLGRAHQGGSLVDIVSDQLGVMVLSASAIHHFGSWGPGMSLFASAYLTFIALAVYAAANRIPTRFVFRVKYLFFGLYSLSLLLDRDLLSWVCSGLAVYYLIEAFLLLARVHAAHAATPKRKPRRPRPWGRSRGE